MKSKSIARPTAYRKPRVRILLICEGKKTEPQYFEELRSAYRHPDIEVCTLHGDHTDPLNLVLFGHNRFLHGGDNGHGKQMFPKAFDEIYILFDRDEHPSYKDAINKARELDSSLCNDFKKTVRFQALPSNPCFELWLVLHYKDISNLPSRNDLFKELKQQWNGYDKGATGLFAKTRQLMPDACKRAKKLNTGSCPLSTEKAYTGVVALVERLLELHQKYTQRGSQSSGEHCSARLA